MGSGQVGNVGLGEGGGLIMQGVSVGRDVHYVLAANDVAADHQHCVGRSVAAKIVKVWHRENGCVNLTVFPDWSNDGCFKYRDGDGRPSPSGMFWATSRGYSEGKEPGTWHFPGAE